METVDSEDSLEINSARGLKVLMISSNFHPYIGGSERQALELSKALRNLGARITVLTYRRPSLAARDCVDGIEVRRFWIPGLEILDSIIFMASIFLWMWTHSSEWDVAHAHMASSPALSAILMSKLLMRPAVVKLSGGRGIGEISTSSKSCLGRLKLALFGWMRPKFISVTEDMALELAEYGIHSRVSVVPNGVDIERFRPIEEPEKRSLRRSLEWPEQSFCFLYAGRLAPEKRLDLLVRAASDVIVEAPSSIYIAFLGAGPERIRLEQVVRDFNMEDRVRFHNPSESVERFCQAADAFVLPSISEGLSNSLLEAMSCGLPVLASRVGGTAEVVRDGEMGILFDPQNMEELKEGIRTLARSPGASKAMGARARGAVEARYDLRRIAERYLELYRS